MATGSSPPRWLAFLASGLLAACGDGGEAPLGDVRAAILGGEPSLSDDAVVALSPRKLFCGPDAAASASCTGTLIAPRLVLTAAHCVAGRRPGDLDVRLGSTSSLVSLAEIRVHPGYDPSSGERDVALLLLDRASAVAPLPLGQASPALVGRQARVVGFGLDESQTGGTRRTGAVKIASVDAALLRYTPGPAMTCSGDSGGPVLLTEDGVERLIGVTRSGDEACAEFGTATLVDAIRADFIDPALIDASSDAPVTSPPLDASRDYCSFPCEDDGDCPASMRCLAQRGVGMRCGFDSLQSGRFGAPCASDEACAPGVCLAGEAGCRCFLPCAAASQAAPPGPPGASNEAASGCQAGARPSWGSPWLVAALGLLWRRRRGAQG